MIYASYIWPQNSKMATIAGQIQDKFLWENEKIIFSKTRK